MNGRDRVLAAARVNGWATIYSSCTAALFTTRTFEVNLTFGRTGAVLDGRLANLPPSTSDMDWETRKAVILAHRTVERVEHTGRSLKADTVIGWLTTHRPREAVEWLWLSEEDCGNPYCENRTTFPLWPLPVEDPAWLWL